MVVCLAAALVAPAAGNCLSCSQLSSTQLLILTTIFSRARQLTMCCIWWAHTAPRVALGVFAVVLSLVVYACGELAAALRVGLVVPPRNRLG